MPMETVIQTVYQGSAQNKNQIKEKNKTVPTVREQASDSVEASDKNTAIVTEEKNGTDILREQAEQIAKDNEKVRKAVEEMNKRAKENTEVVFGIHDKTNRMTIKIIQKDNKKVLKEYPPEETLDMIAKVWELAGMVVDEKM